MPAKHGVGAWGRQPCSQPFLFRTEGGGGGDDPSFRFEHFGVTASQPRAGEFSNQVCFEGVTALRYREPEYRRLYEEAGEEQLVWYGANCSK